MITSIFFPEYTLRRTIASKVYHTLLGQAAKNPFHSVANFFNTQNLRNYNRYAGKRLICNVCGFESKMMYDFPNVKNRTEHRIGVLRETLQCRKCGATMRDRTLAYALLNELARGGEQTKKSVAELSKFGHTRRRILDTDSFSIMSGLLKHSSDYIRSSFTKDAPLGIELESNRYNIDLQNINFSSESFDIVLTSDVAEHVRDIDRAHREIYRILRDGGVYIFTVPYDSDCETHHVLVDTSSNEDKLLVPAQLHGDPLTGGVLAYRVFGRQIFQDLNQIGFSVEYFSVNEAKTGIFGGDVFVATKKLS